MGVCASCLGQRRAQHGTTESSRLLYDDLQQSQYGSLNGAAVQGSPPAAAQDQQREVAEQRRILAQTSEYLIDIFPPRSSTASVVPAGYAPASDARRRHYAELMRNIVPSGVPFEPQSVGSEFNARDGILASYTPDKAGQEPSIPGVKAVHREHVGQLVAGFAASQTESRGDWQGPL